MKRITRRPSGKDLRQRSASFSAPVLGWNTRDNFVNMDPRYARVLDNLVVDGGRVSLRKGFTLAAGTEFLPESLAAYDYAGAKTLLVAGENKIFTVDVSARTITQVAEGLLGNRWKTVFYKGYLYFLNGQDPVQVYHDGTLSQASFTAADETAVLDTARLKGGCLYRNRLFFLQRESLSFWYTQDAGAVQGKLMKFDLAQLSRFGGELACCAAWTSYSASGAAESQLVLVSTEGEVFVYGGDNPSEIDSWELRGTYKIPRPIGQKCLCPLGGDLVYLGEDGYYLMSRLLSAPQAERAAAFSDAINPTLQELKSSFKNEGWQAVAFQPDSLLFINVPQTGATPVQHVMNLQTGAWSRFTGLPAQDWAELDGKLYFCGPGGVYRAQQGYTDGGNSIAWRFMSAYGHLGTPYAKALKELQLYYQGQYELRFDVSVSVDFKKEYVAYRSNPAAPESRWDESAWDETSWGAEASAVKKRIVLRTGQGTYFSLGASGTLRDMDVKILGYDLFFETSKNMA